MSLFYEPVVALAMVSLIFFIREKQPNWDRTFLFLFLGYALLDHVLTALPFEYQQFRFLDLEMNWEGKIFSYLLFFVFILTYQKLPKSEYGLTLNQAPGTRTYIIRVIAITSVLFLIYGILIGGFSGGLENILFQLTMPSIVEELSFRGILLGLLNQMLPKKWTLGKTEFGFGVVLTALLFGLWHGLSISNDFTFSFNTVTVLFTGAIGFFLGLVRERTGSLVVPIILHILINLIPNLVGLFM